MAEDTSGKPPPLMGATAIRPPERVGMERYTYFLYDPKNGTVLSRTPKSWALIILFYCIYYSCLAGFWLACMKIFLTIQIQNPEDGKPTWTLDASIIGVNPGVGVRPSQPDEHVSSGIFTLDLEFDGTAVPPDYKDANKVEGSKGYAYRGADFFKVYDINKKESGDGTGDGVECGAKHISGETGYRKDNLKGKFCLFDRATLQGCAKFPYGYGKDDLKPCVFLKFNRIFDLKPQPITKDTVNDESLTKDPSAQEFLKQLEEKDYPNEVFIKCDGEYPADKEALGEEGLKMYPETAGIKNAAGIPLKYFPYSKYRKGKNESPLVAIQFPNVKNFPGRLIHIICKAYYAGVVHSKKNKAGLVKFQMHLKTKAHDEV